MIEYLLKKGARVKLKPEIKSIIDENFKNRTNNMNIDNFLNGSIKLNDMIEITESDINKLVTNIPTIDNCRLANYVRAHLLGTALNEQGVKPVKEVRIPSSGKKHETPLAGASKVISKQQSIENLVNSTKGKEKIL